MADAVEMAIKLRDGVSKPANNAASALSKVRKQAEGLNSAGAGLRKFQRQTDDIADASGRLRRITGGGAGGGGGMLGALGIGGAIGAGAGLVGMLGAAASKAIELSIALAKVAANAAIAFGKAITGAVVLRESSVMAFKQLGGAGADGVKQFERVKSLAFEFGVPLQDAVQQFQSMQRMGFAFNDIERMFKRFQDLRALNVSADQINRAVVAITQIKATGKLQGDELMQLADAGVSIDEVYKALGKRLKKTVPEIIKLKEAGKITAADAIAGIEDAMSKMAGGRKPGEFAKEVLGESFGGVMQRLRTLGPILLDDIAAKVQPAFKKLRPILEDVLDAFRSPAVGSAFDAIAKVIGGMVDTVAAAWPTIKAFAGGIGEGFTKGWDSAMKGWNAFASGAGGNKQAVADLTTVARAAGMAIGHMAAALAATAVALANAEKAARSAFKPLSDVSGLGLGTPMAGGPKGFSGGGFGLGGLIPTGSSLLGAQMAAGGGGKFAEAAGDTINSGNSFSTSIAVTASPTEREIANTVRREVERLLQQKLSGLPV